MNIKLSDNSFTNGYINDKHTKHAKGELLTNGVPHLNFEFTVEKVEGKYLSWVLIDHDANPVVGFSWIHWLVANIEVTDKVIINEKFNPLLAGGVRGINSFSSPLVNAEDEITYSYGGPTPPDCDHTYTLYVIEHEEALALSDKFYLNQLIDALDDWGYSKIEFKARV